MQPFNGRLDIQTFRRTCRQTDGRTTDWMDGTDRQTCRYWYNVKHTQARQSFSSL